MAVHLPALPGPQEAAWHALFELYERQPDGWTLVGGQLVHLHCAERGLPAARPTDDADAALDVRRHPRILLRVTAVLQDMGFRSAGVAPGGAEHRWRRGDASIDVLIPSGVGQRAADRKGVTDSPTVAGPGMQQALDRSEDVVVDVNGRTGRVMRPRLLGALVLKAAAHTVPGDADRRHRVDFLTLAMGLSRRDAEADRLRSRDLTYLRTMCAAIDADPVALAAVDGASLALSRVKQLIAV